MEEADRKLLEAAQAGDAKALDALLAKLEGAVYRFGLRMCRDPEDAREVLQETLLAAVRTLPGFRGDSSLSTWLYTIARSFCIKQRRKGKHEPDAIVSLDDASSVADTGRAPDEATAGRQLKVALDRAIDALEPGQREVLMLRDVEGLTAPEVAEVLGIGIDAVKSRLHRARVSVRERVAPLLQNEPPAPPAAGCPDVATLFSQHLEGEIDAETCAAMERHLEGCLRCRTVCDSLRQTLSSCKAARSSTVPADVQESVRKAVRALLAESFPGSVALKAKGAKGDP